MTRHFTIAVLLGTLSCGQAPQEEALDEPVVEPAAPAVRRLTAPQYERVVTDLFGEGLVMPTSLEPDVAFEGLQSIGASTTSLSQWGVERYEDAAYLLAEQAVADTAWRTAHVPCGVGEVDEPCIRQMLDDLGRRMYRRSLTEPEAARIVGVVDAVGSASGDSEIGLTYALAALLQSPHFLYRVETGEPSGSVRRLTDVELASRLSFLLWDTIPDVELLDAAENGDLASVEGVASHVDRMMTDPRFEQGVRALFTDLLVLYRLEELNKDPLIFTHASPDLGPSAREETLNLLTWLIIEQDGDFRDLLTTQETFVDTRLAALYDIPAPSMTGFSRTTLPYDGRRRGLLGHASLLTLHAHSGASSPTLRGHFVRHVLLCQEIPPPPGDVDTTIPEPDADALTMRDRLASHRENPACATCHDVMDPIGLGLENFDGIGRWRDTENGASIDASGDLDGAGFANAWTLADAMRSHELFMPCMAEHLVAYATAHVVKPEQEALVEWMVASNSRNGHSYRAMMRDLVTSEAFRTVGAF